MFLNKLDFPELHSILKVQENLILHNEQQKSIEVQTHIKLLGEWKNTEQNNIPPMKACQKDNLIKEVRTEAYYFKMSLKYKTLKFKKKWRKKDLRESVKYWQ